MDQRSYHQSIREDLSTQRDPQDVPPPDGSIHRIGLVGCGRMGSAIAGHLLAAGWPLTVTDVSPEAVAPLTERGAEAAATPTEVVATSDLTLLVVVDDEQVRQVMSGPGGILAAPAEGSIVAICSSVRPDTCREMAEAGRRRGIQVVDVALVRGERGAELGELLLLCGGPEEVIDVCQPAFGAFASDVARVGDVGAGQVAKTVNNILLWACIRADLEALRLGRALGVEPAILRSVLALGSGANRPLVEWGQHRLRWPGKDLETAIALAQEAGVDLPLVKSLAPLMDQLSVDDLHDLG
jgi:3-hydroxyisobutyrate dehydrogenase-like beta-hydroxyacid dehydrogenase